ncbi:MAG: threonine/serine exporter family protein [Clostridiaceae bacterium]|nr:threonine/serine exporter family protein [Clostridiaceae bacterium]
MEQEKILDIAVRAGLMLLSFGGETYRVEDTIKRICLSYNLKCEPFVLPTGLFVSAEGEKGVTTICKRVSSRTVDLKKIARINDLSRRIEYHKPDYEEIKSELDNIAQDSSYSRLTVIISYALTSFTYALIFGGSRTDALSALFIGVILGLLRFVFSKDNSFPFIDLFVDGFVTGILGPVIPRVIPDTNAYVIITGVLTNLVPGVALTNGVRDLLHGDTISGLAKLGEAIIIVAVIAAGTAVGLFFWGGFS